MIPEHIELSRHTTEKVEQVTHLPAEYLLEDYDIMCVLEKKKFPNESWDDMLFRMFSEWH